MAVAFAEATTLNRGCCVKMTPVRFLNAMKVAGLSLVVARRTLGFSVPRVSPSLFRMAMSTTAASNVKLDEGKLMQDMLHRIREVNYIPQDIKPTIVDFTVDGIKLGKVLPDVAKLLCEIQIDQPEGSVFEMNGNELRLSEKVAGDTNDSRTKAIGEVMEQLRQNGVVTGWRDELYPISDSFYGEPVFLMERAATSLLGVLEYGVHINGLVKGSPESEPMMWIARRSATKSKFPGMLDHLVAGGQPAGLSLMDNVIKECDEEAGVPEDLARAGIQPVGAISYEGMNASNTRISRVVLFNYDLYLPQDFVPKPVDGEVEEFFLWSIDQIKESMALDFDDPIKPNCYVVIIEYLLRMGYLSPETPGYLDVLRELRGGDCR